MAKPVVKKRRVKKSILCIFTIAFLLVWVLLGVYILNHETIDTTLKKIGYSKTEITTLKKKLETENLKKLKDYDYHKTIVHIVEEEEFKEEYLIYYLNFLKQNKNADSDDIVFLVNHGKEEITYTPDIHAILHSEQFQIENLDQYLLYYKEHEIDGNQVVDIVNQSLEEKPTEEPPKEEEKEETPPKQENNSSNEKDKNEEDDSLEDLSSLFLGKEYTVAKNLDRYQDYYRKHQDLDVEEVIRRVNSNLDKVAYQDISPSDLSKGNLLLVNKYYYLSSSYVPSNLVSIDSQYGTGQIKEEAYQAFIEMYNDASLLGLYPYIQSPYRSYSRQNTLYTNYVKRDGKAEADTYSARPGYSEHQTGLAMDLGTYKNHSIGDFEKSAEFKWVSENAHNYGFILRYPKGKEYITGYMYEPWHYRYVGKEIAKYIYEHNLTYEEYYAYFIN